MFNEENTELKADVVGQEPQGVDETEQRVGSDDKEQELDKIAQKQAERCDNRKRQMTPNQQLSAASSSKPRRFMLLHTALYVTS